MSALIIILLIPVISSFASDPSMTVVHYAVSSMGFVIGDITTTQRITDEDDRASINFETKTAVKALFLWMGYQQDTIEKGTLQKGNLVSYSRKGLLNGVTIDVKAQLENTAFRFDVRERGATRSITIPRNSYDFTTMECPEARLDFSDKNQVTLHILDVEEMAVVKREYRLVQNAHYSIAGKEYPCRIVDYSDQNKKARRWINWDGTTAVMFRQEGRSEKNSYSVQALSVSNSM